MPRGPGIRAGGESVDTPLEIERGARSPDPRGFWRGACRGDDARRFTFRITPSWVASIYRIRQVYLCIRILAHSD
jgi:hypothetical protein